MQTLVKGWFYTAASRTKTRDGLVLRIKELPLHLIQESRLDVIAEMARLRLLHEETRTRVHGTPITADADATRLEEARAALNVARRAFRVARP